MDAPALCEAAKALGAAIDEAQAGSLLAYLDAVLLLNEQINLTGVRDRDQAIVLHVLDGLAFARTGLAPHHVLDLGSGNGFPGVAVAVLHPRATVTLLDRTGKKVRAMGTCLLTARIQGVETLQLDAAQAPALRKEMRQAFDLVTARAVGAPALVAELAAPLVRRGGRLALWLDADAEAPAEMSGWQREAEHVYDLPAPAARTRRIAVWRR